VSEVLITGFPQLVVRRLVRELVAQGDSVSILVRHPQRADAEAFLASCEGPRRGRALLGDVLLMDLGLSGPEIRRLLEEVELIYHCAAVHPNKRRPEEAERVNVEGTRSMVELALEADQLRRFNFLSTAFVSGERRGVVLEDDLDHGRRFRTEFERTKYEAERIVRRAMGDMPVSVFRPGLIVGDSRTGEFTPGDDPADMMIAFLEIPFDIAVPLPGRGDYPLHLVPVDYVAKAMATLGKDPRAAGLTFHLTDPNPLPARRVLELVADRAGRRHPVGSIPAGLARRLLKIPGLGRLGPPERVVDYFNQLVIYNTTNTLRLLEGTGIQCPTFESYVGSLVSQLQRVTKGTAGRPYSGQVSGPSARSERSP